MARPSIPVEERRAFFIRVRITSKQQEALLQLSKQLGRKPCDIVRKRLFTGRFPVPKMERVDLATYMELKKIGVNINQLAWHANAGRFPHGIGELLSELKQYEARLLDLLQADDSDTKDR